MATATPRAAHAGNPPTQPVAAGNGSARPSKRAPLDTTVRIVTPERIVFEYPLAGPFRRAIAYLIDLLVIVALLIAMAIGAMTFTLGVVGGIGPMLVGYFLVTWGYGAVCETAFNGRTLGKRAMGVRVLAENGIPITAAQAVLRNLVGAADGMIPFFYVIGLTSMVLTRRFQRLGDLAAGTMVVIDERQRPTGVARVSEKEVEALLPWLPLRVAAGPELSRALSDYVKRRGRFGPGLREEMAAPLARPLRARYGLPDDATSDAVLCALYHRVFLGE